MSWKDDVEATIMALRQGLMEYFKGSAVDNVVRPGNIVWSSHGERTTHHYQAERNRFKNRMTVSIGNNPLITVEREPDLLCLHLGTLDRSKTMRKIKEGIETVRNSYLTSVILRTDSTGNHMDWKQDRTLVTQSNRVVINRDDEEDTIDNLFYID